MCSKWVGKQSIDKIEFMFMFNLYKMGANSEHNSKNEFERM